MLLLKLAIGFWLISEIIYYYDCYKTHQMIWYGWIADIAHSLSCALFFYFVYNVVIDLAVGENQLWNGLIEIAQKIGAV